MKILDWLKDFFRKLFRKKNPKLRIESLSDLTPLYKGDMFKGLQDLFKRLIPKHPNFKPQPSSKKRGRGYTKSPYNFAKVKRRRKIAKASRIRNRI